MRGWAYLATVIDGYSRKVVGWSIDRHMRESLVCDALTMAIHNRRPAVGEVDRLLLALASHDLSVVGRQVGALGLDRGPGALGEHVGQPGRTLGWRRGAPPPGGARAGLGTYPPTTPGAPRWGTDSCPGRSRQG